MIKTKRTIRQCEAKKGEYSKSSQEIAKKRTERQPLGIRKQKLNAPKIEGFYLRWINDIGARLEEAKRAGYEFVLNGNKKISTKVDSEDGSKKSYLMKQLNEFRKEDLLRKRKRVKETLGTIKSLKQKVDNQYDPNDKESKKLSHSQLQQIVEYMKQEGIELNK